MADPQSPSTAVCAVCGSTVPAAAFCENCGADRAAKITERQRLLRPRAFVAAPREPITLPLVTSSLCPHLADTDRIPFRHGLFLALALLICLSVLKILPAIVVLTALGIPLLFVVYLWRSGIFRDLPARALLLAPIIAIALSVSWWLWTGNLVARAYGIPLAGGFQIRDLIDLGLAATFADSVLMLVPAAVVRLLRLPSCESLDGFIIGALGALCYTSAGTITWLTPQFTRGLLDSYSQGRLLSEGILYGIFDPLTAAAAGGMFGLLLWFRPARRPGDPAWMRLRLVVCALLGASYYIAVYSVGAANASRLTEAVINTGITALALLTLRVAIQMAVLHESPDPATSLPVRCIRCERTVPDTPFCPDCGGAARASARSARHRSPAA
ncbi:MAG: zinc ribbon domain-containing protein [Mycobacterium sp.]|nr:zinc ribbon domain-containing protein [Mycobacterium sp.]